MAMFHANLVKFIVVSIKHVLDAFSGVSESSVSFDISTSKSEPLASVKRKRVNRELKVDGEHPKKQVSTEY